MGVITWSIIGAGIGIFVYRSKLFVTRPDNTVGLTDFALQYIPDNLKEYIPPDLAFDQYFRDAMDRATKQS
jgi:hypothetical protein